MKYTIVFVVALVLMGAALTSAARSNCICTADYSPVCGKDGRTYSNSCSMTCAGVQLAYRGECGKGTDRRYQF